MEQKKEILRLMELCYNYGQENIRTGKSHNLLLLYDVWKEKYFSNIKK